MTTSSEIKLIGWTFVAVVILGVAAAASLLQPPKGFEHFAQASHSVRSIASISPQKSVLAESHATFKTVVAEMQTFDVKASCTPEGPIKIAASVREIRLSGANCASRGKIVTTQIKNVSNGFVATVFRTSAKSFTTDYVTLAKGANRLLVREELVSGKINEREYEITRAD